MKAPTYLITFKDNTHAILAERLFEEEHDFPMDFRDSNVLAFSKEWWDMQGESLEDIQKKIDDVCMVGELDYTPEIVIDENYEWSLDEYELIQDKKDSIKEGFSPSFAEDEE